MSPRIDDDRWRAIDALFQTALDRPAGERVAYVRAAAEGDAALRDAVLELLHASDAAGDFLGLDTVAAIAAELVEENAPDEPELDGRRIGPYRVIRRLGRGGMGAVYLAERADGAFEQTVALKVLRRGLDTGDVLGRFLAERQILASLEHPAIARLLDGGETDDGRPYLVMEYIDGRPIDKYCETRGLGVEARLRHFLDVADAVQYAHRGLVIHRDLKPSNILVTDEGAVKLVDFGIAKLLDREIVPRRELDRTRPGLFPLTPSYAAPEQIRPGSVTTATDVYALGTLLYALLAGRLPHDPHAPTYDLLRAICEEDPVPPSAAVGQNGVGDDGSARSAGPGPRPTKRLRRRLRGDLDAIVLKAMRKDPGDRYPTAEAMAEDVRRHLDGDPVLARRGTWSYRAGKLVRRHAWGFAAIAALVLLAAGWAATLVRQKTELARTLTLVEAEAAKASQVAEFMVDLFEASDPAETRGDPVTARDLLERGVQRAERLAGQPVVHAELLQVTGRMYARIGRFDEAERILTRALERQRTLHGNEHAEVAATLHALGRLEQTRRAHAEAERYFREALTIRRAVLGADAPAVAASLSALAGVLRDQGELDGAAAAARRALELRRRRPDQNQDDVLAAQLTLAYVLRARDSLSAAERLYRDALAEQRRRLPPDHPDLAATLNNLAYLLRERGDFAAAESAYREALDIHRTAYGEAHPRTLTLMSNLASVLSNQGRTDETERLLRERVELAKEHMPPGHWRIGSTLVTGVGRFLMARQDCRRALPVLREGLENWAAALGPSHEWTARARNMVGACMLALSRADTTPAQLARSESRLARAAVESPDPGLRTHFRYMADFFDGAGMPDRADRYRTWSRASAPDSAPDGVPEA